MRRSSTDEKAHVPAYPWGEGGWMKKHEVPIHEKKVDKWRSTKESSTRGRSMNEEAQVHIHEKTVDVWRSTKLSSMRRRSMNEEAQVHIHEKKVDEWRYTSIIHEK
jgi:hypothetical protein